MAKRPERAGNGARRAAPIDAAPPEPSAAPAATSAMDSLEDWTAQTTREQLATEIAACRAVLRGARAVREVQLQAAERAESTHLKAAEQLAQANGFPDVARIQLDLLQADFDQALQYWTRLSEASVRTLFDTLQESAAHWTRLNTGAWEAWTQWSQLQAKAALRSDIAEAEMEHVANPLAASPLFWPMQEAARQTLDAAHAAWHDWADWTSRLGRAGDAPAR